MGLSRLEIAAHVAEIIAFVHIGEHIDQPVKRYSSGMVVRLGSAITTIILTRISSSPAKCSRSDVSLFKRSAWRGLKLTASGVERCCLCRIASTT